METNTNNSTSVDTQTNSNTQVDNTETTVEVTSNKEQSPDEYQKRLSDLEAREKAVETKEKEMQLKKLRKESFDILKDKGIGEHLHEKISELINYEDRDKCIESIEKVTDILNKLTEPLVNDRLRGNYVPKRGGEMSASNNKKTSTTFENEVKNVKNKIFK